MEFKRNVLDFGKLILFRLSQVLTDPLFFFSFSVLRNGMWHTIMWKEVKTNFKDMPEGLGWDSCS